MAICRNGRLSQLSSDDIQKHYDERFVVVSLIAKFPRFQYKKQFLLKSYPSRFTKLPRIHNNFKVPHNSNNQSINQPTNQPINQSIDRSILTQSFSSSKDSKNKVDNDSA